jgi:hypothetical protein
VAVVREERLVCDVCGDGTKVEKRKVGNGAELYTLDVCAKDRAELGIDDLIGYGRKLRTASTKATMQVKSMDEVKKARKTAPRKRS